MVSGRVERLMDSMPCVVKIDDALPNKPRMPLEANSSTSCWLASSLVLSSLSRAIHAPMAAPTTLMVFVWCLLRFIGCHGAFPAWVGYTAVATRSRI